MKVHYNIKEFKATDYLYKNCLNNHLSPGRYYRGSSGYKSKVEYGNELPPNTFGIEFKKENERNHVRRALDSNRTMKTTMSLNERSNFLGNNRLTEQFANRLLPSKELNPLSKAKRRGRIKPDLHEVTEQSNIDFGSSEYLLTAAPPNNFKKSQKNNQRKKLMKGKKKKTTAPEIINEKDNSQLMTASKTLDEEESTNCDKKHDVLVIGDINKNLSLAEAFKSKMDKKTMVQRERRRKKAKRRPGSTDINRKELRRKMMGYGRKVKQSNMIRRPESGVALGKASAIGRQDKAGDSHFKKGLSFMSLDGNQIQKELNKRDRPRSPEPDVLERLARGIKPKVNKKEAKEITKRQMARFKKKKDESSSSYLSKRLHQEEIRKRQKKAKELDKRVREHMRRKRNRKK